VTPDGSHVLAVAPNVIDIMMLALTGGHRTLPLLQTGSAERNGVVSPNGRWLAYESNAAGRFDIYVRPFPNVGAGGLWRISPAGGTRALWARSGQELFYVAPDGALMAVRVDARSDTWLAGSPARIIEGPYETRGLRGIRTYDVSDDGRRFLMVKQAPAALAGAPTSSSWRTGTKS
jgi:eukaryotic-like serine/threonine-protein kinase